MTEAYKKMSVTHLVTGADFADTLSQNYGDRIPRVFSTMKMIGLMELAASRCLTPLLDEGDVSVGVKVDIMHTAPTCLGAIVITTAHLVEQDGKFYKFEIVAQDDGGEIGRGFHTRAIVKEDRIIEKARSRNNLDSELG